MLNIGPPELLLIIVIALVVVGPQRLPDLGRTIGKGLREFRKVQDEVRDMVNTGLDDDLKQTANELKQTASDLRKATDVRSAFRNTPHQARARAAAAVQKATTPDPDEDDAPSTDDAKGDVAAPSTNGDGPATTIEPESEPVAETDTVPAPVTDEGGSVPPQD
jgi:Tat protein translocase TatB subunit